MSGFRRGCLPWITYLLHPRSRRRLGKVTHLDMASIGARFVHQRLVESARIIVGETKTQWLRTSRSRRFARVKN